MRQAMDIGRSELETNGMIMEDGVTVANALSIAMMYAQCGGWQDMSRNILASVNLKINDIIM